MLRNLAMQSEYQAGDQLADPIGLIDLGQAANHFASQSAFSDYRSRRAYNTTRHQDTDLNLFAEFIRSTGVTVGDLAGDPNAWQGVTWGLVAAFQGWQLGKGYAIGTVNLRISTLKTYAGLAFKAGALGATDYALIKAVEGYSHKETRRIDEKRVAAGVDTRFSESGKKASPVAISPTQAADLKAQPDTPQGRRDRLIMCLLIDHGLRVGELAGLIITNFDLETGTMSFYRPKVDRTQTHQLTGDTWRAAVDYLKKDIPVDGWHGVSNLAEGFIWRRSVKGGALGDQGLTDRAITERVRYLGAKVGLAGLSAHDCRHYWATMAARSGTPIDRLQDAGGWSSPAMPLRYIEAAKIANQGVLLG